MPSILLCRLASEPVARGAGCGGWTYCNPDQLRKLSECELDHIFAHADAGPIPVGSARGRVLLMTNTRMPRMKTRMTNAVWKGKVFGDDGYFINQWVCFQALDSTAGHGLSWFDGKPCIEMEYAPGTPIFANTRDELRQIGANLYLGRLYDRFPCPKFRGYILLQVQSCGGGNRH